MSVCSHYIRESSACQTSHTMLRGQLSFAQMCKHLPKCHFMLLLANIFPNIILCCFLQTFAQISFYADFCKHLPNYHFMLLFANICPNIILCCFLQYFFPRPVNHWRLEGESWPNYLHNVFFANICL